MLTVTRRVSFAWSRVLSRIDGNFTDGEVIWENPADNMILRLRSTLAATNRLGAVVFGSDPLANGDIGLLAADWDSNRVAEIRLRAGVDDTNKDEGVMKVVVRPHGVD